MKKIGVVGAGVMGAGVSQSAASAGFEIILLDVAEEILNKARQSIENNLRMQVLMKKMDAAEIDTVLQNISFTTNMNDLKDVDFLVENATEKWDVKSAIYPAIDEICRKDCIFAVNTSCISITKIAALTKRPEQIVGIHFMNPVPMKPTVEMIRGYHTSEETIETAKQFLAKMNKTCILANDMPGFISNRVLMLTINEAVFLVQDQVAAVEDVDQLFRECFGHKMGPLETADLIGLDTILYSIEALYESYSDSKYRPSPLLVKMVDAGLYGMKSGKGFYDYQ